MRRDKDGLIILKKGDENEMKRKDKEPRVKKEEDEKVEIKKPKKEFKIEIVKAGNLEETVDGVRCMTGPDLRSCDFE